MNDEVAILEDQVSAPEQIAESQEAETVAAEGDDTQQVEHKTFTQEELDKVVQKEKAKAERRANKAYQEKLEALSRESQSVKETPKATETTKEGKPKLGDFENVEDYVEAVADWKLAQRESVGKQVKEQEVKQTQEVARALKAQSIFAEAEKNPAFDRDEFDAMPVTSAMADAILDSDLSAKIVLHLAANPNDVERISKLSPARQAAEIGKIEVALVEKKTVKVSSAPAPIRPVGNRGGEVSKNIENMTMAEFEEHERKRGARWVRR